MSDGKNAVGLKGFPTPNTASGIDAYLLFLFPDETWAQWILGALEPMDTPENYYESGELTTDEAAEQFRLIVEQAPYNLLPESDTVPAPYWDEANGDDADDEAPIDDQHWYGQWDGETFLETVSYVFLTAFLSTLVSPQAAIKFLTIPRTFRLMVRQTPHGAKLLLFLDGGLYGVINGYAPLDHVVEMIVVSPGTEMLLVHSGEHDPSATPDEDGNYTIDCVRMRLDADEVTPPYIRYDGDPPVYQTTNDGGVTWVDQPESDPRYSPTSHLTPLDPYTGIECDVAARMTAQLHDTLDIFIATGDAAQFATGVIAIAVFPLGLVGWFIDLLLFVANALIDIGQSTIEAAFTEAVYDDIQCTLSCYIDENGQISQTSLDTAYEVIKADHAGVVATVIDELRFFYGDAAMSNAGVARDETGDCSACPDCDWVVEYDFSISSYGFEPYLNNGTARGVFVGDHFEATLLGGQLNLFLVKFMAGIEVSQVSAYEAVFHGTGAGNGQRQFDAYTNNPWSGASNETGALETQDPVGWRVIHNQAFTTTGGIAMDWFADTNGTGNIAVYKIRISGTGTPPVDGVRVPSLV